MDWGALTLFLMITGRMTGFVAFNPLFGRRGIPGMVKAGLILLLSITVYSIYPGQLQVPSGMLVLGFEFLLEMGLGYVLGLVMNLFFYIPLLAGSTIDTQMGLSMGATYDPAIGIQVTATSTLLNVLLMLLFFVSNGHHTLIRVMVNSSQLVPFGQVALGSDLTGVMVELFINCTLLGIKLCMPILAAELLGQVGMGILMKAIPQINVFAINIELKVIIGLGLLLALLTPFSEFLLGVENEMLRAIQRVLPVMAR